MADTHNSQTHPTTSSRPSESSSQHSQQSRQSLERLRGGHTARSSQDTSGGSGRRAMSPDSNRAWRKRSPTTDSEDSLRKDTRISWESQQHSQRSSPSTSKELDRSRAGLLDGVDQDDEEAGLKYEYRNRRRRKRANTFPLGEIPLGPLTPKEEKKIADLAVIKSSLINVMLIALWYTFSLSISLVRHLFLHLRTPLYLY